MGFRFRKSTKVGPFRLNVSKSGVGWSVGVPGLRYTKKANGGNRTTASIPGTGISYVADSGKTPSKNARPSSGSGSRSGCSKWILILALWPITLSVLFWKSEKVNLSKKAKAGILAVVWLALFAIGASEPSTESVQTAPSAVTSVSAPYAMAPSEESVASSGELDSLVVEESPETQAVSVAESTTESEVEEVQEEEETVTVMVWVPTNGGTKYHSRSGCSGMKDPVQVPLDRAIAQGFSPCKRCY